MRFYHYGAQDALMEPARRFFALANAMYQLETLETARTIFATAGGMSENPNDLIKELEKEAKGISGILEEVRNIKEK